MSGPENYKEFDTTSIVSRDTVTVGKLTLRKRDLLLGGIAAIALIIAIILAIVLAVEAGKNSAACPYSAPAVTDEQKSNGTATTDDETCITPICLKTASYERYIMNETANPCTNFYQFACGGYANMYAQSQLVPDQSPYNQIEAENIQKMLYLLDYTIERNEEQSYERKLRHFLRSCNNHFDKMQIRGQPMLNKIIKPFGGWYVLDDKWDPVSFNLHKQMKIVHVDFWTPAFFAIQLSTDTTNWNKKVLEFDFGGLGLQYAEYVFMQQTNRTYTLYTDYMKKVARMLSRDADITADENRIDQFVRDAVEVETDLATLVYWTNYQAKPHAPENRMSLGALNQLVNNSIDFVDYLKTQFPDVESLFTADATVAVLLEGFFHKLGPKLMNYTSTNEGIRKLHNYLVWQLINNYIDDLSWDYVHAKRQVTNDIYGVKDSSSGYRYCIQVAEKNMRDALGALFVKNYVNQNDRQELGGLLMHDKADVVKSLWEHENSLEEQVDYHGLVRLKQRGVTRGSGRHSTLRGKAKNILESIKEEMYAAIRNFSWMTPENRESAVTKIKEGIYKLGYPDFMIDESYLDSMYSIITINETDYFSNVLSLNLAGRKRFSDLLAKPDSKTLWVYPVYNARIEYYNPWHELILTSGMLQYPLFAHNGPTYYNFGGIGSLLARHLIHAVDEFGSYYKMDKSSLGVWWSSSTAQHYADIKQCAIDAQKGRPIGPFVINDHTFSANGTSVGLANAPELLADATGLKLAYKAYKGRMASAGTEKMPAGFPSYSLNKLFFVAYAQAHCNNYRELTRAKDAIFYYIPPADFKVNLAVSQVEEFREAFGCKVGDPMAPAKTCTLF